MIVDASVVLRAFFPDEAQEPAQRVMRDFITGRIPLKGPSLLPYELSNAVWQAERRGRLENGKAAEILRAMQDLEIEILKQDLGSMLPLARRFNLSAYDAAYLSLAETLGEPLITGDLRLYNSVKAHLPWVLWIETY